MSTDNRRFLAAMADSMERSCPGVLSPLPKLGCLCGHFESCDSCRPRRLTRADCEREDAAAALDPSNHPCVTLGDE